MKICKLYIRNFKSVEELCIDDIESALIFVGKNNVGKSTMIDAIRAVSGDYDVSDNDFHDSQGNIIIGMDLQIGEDDMHFLHANGIVSKFKHFELWKKDFENHFPSYSEGILSFEYVYSRDGVIRYKDGVKKNNQYIKSIFPKIYYVDNYNSRRDIKDDIIMLQGNVGLNELRENRCIFDKTKVCNQCFQCIGKINKKSPAQLDLMETTRLMQYKIFDLNLNSLSEKINKNFEKNGGQSEEIRYEVRFDSDEIFKIETIVYNRESNTYGDISLMGEGLRRIYILSLLETYIETKNIAPYIIIIETPENYLHPQLQKVAGEILYKLSEKNQVIFSTHSPTMLFNFTSKQIRQVVADREYNTTINEDTDIDDILDDLGYSANDLMNVSFVFIVEGKQDKSRLPLLLDKYYSEIYDELGKLQRIAIVATNSCTNIKTYANLKYINTLYLKDQFMMIRDSDGKDPKILGKQLCRYYEDRSYEDKGNLPRVTSQNVLILRYYSFENYFLFPEIMAKIGIIKNEEEFYDILWTKYKEYLYKLSSVKNMLSKLNININSRQSLKDNMENIRIYVRGHNLYDIFYGRYKGKNENNILVKYIEAAPRETFKDILDSIDGFIYFKSRKKFK